MPFFAFLPQYCRSPS